jgi:hypothetical protein
MSGLEIMSFDVLAGRSVIAEQATVGCKMEQLLFEPPGTTARRGGQFPRPHAKFANAQTGGIFVRAD